MQNPGIYYRIGCGALRQEDSTLVLFCLPEQVNGEWQIRHKTGEGENDGDQFELFRNSELMTVESWSPDWDL